MGSQMVPVASASTPFEARLLAARLGSEGILWQLRGEVDGLYPIGAAEVLVAPADVGRAREVLALAEDDDGGDAPLVDDPEVGPRSLPGAGRAWVPALLLGLAVLAACTRLAQGMAG